MDKYTAITFAPVQGFIEKSRKLRDLYGASLILSYLSQQIVSYVDNHKDLKLISPALPSVQKGMPNRILIKGEMSKEEAEKIILSAWKEMLKVCREWIQKKLPEFHYEWEREWTLWGCHTWEVFQGCGDSIKAAMDDLETNKLSRDWSAVNWIGESSSLTGTDGIAFPGLGSDYRNPKTLNYGLEDDKVKDFYTKLARKLDNCPDDKEPEGKYIAPNEKLSIPELVKRLVTWYGIGQKLGMETLEESFKDIQRKPEPSKNIPGQWTGWFMGDGDKVGDHLKELAKKDNGDEEIHQFSDAIRNWGKDFDQEFPENLGRIVYAGGDDFLGIIYSKDSKKPIPAFTAYEWLRTLKDKWKEHKQGINVSVGFVWVAGSVPQRDVLQHCREAEKVAKSLGRDRVTIRVVFNSGQYVQWTCPWDYLGILMKYRDRDGKTFYEWECKGRKKEDFPNWGHVYSDLATLKARHAINLNAKGYHVDERIALELFNIYFEKQKEYLENQQEKIVGKSDNLELMKWIDGLIHIGWHLCSNI
ncbi:CRISPR-associated protein Cmr2 [Anabaena sphaerica FACHB-251]|uniref:CRISPR-associated protein Cmr2 n=1 Tax=Anabaena sphaerica FACHB-251 TaxID=2692883 RepID=A0A926WDA8_9NOST|nr:CRISPR-associated protein Cmr2 [Anabaena sphaerica FACHB-251]